MKQIELTKGYVATVDDADFEQVSQYRWVALVVRNVVYAVRRFKRHDGKWGTEYLHRFLMAPPGGMVVDHINHDGLNNQRSNLRLATTAQNSRNVRKPVTNTSGYKGVHWIGWGSSAGKWCASVVAGGRKTTVGYYSCPIEAARAYDKAALELHGEFAVINFELDKEAA